MNIHVVVILLVSKDVAILQLVSQSVVILQLVSQCFVMLQVQNKECSFCILIFFFTGIEVTIGHIVFTLL